MIEQALELCREMDAQDLTEFLDKLRDERCLECGRVENPQRVLRCQCWNDE